MKFLSRIVWSEGMYLGPHHFQAQTRFFEDYVRFATASLWHNAHGLTAYELDAEALRNGTVSLLHARGIFPDGLGFDMPECDPLPAARGIAEVFPPTRDRVVVSLALPRMKPDGQNCALNGDGNENVRFTGWARTLHDENTGHDEKPVQVARKNIRLVLEQESTEDMVTLPLTCVMRDGRGHFINDPAYIPPLLSLTGSEALIGVLRRVIEILEEKGATLARTRGAAGKFQAGMSQGDVASFWFLHSINASLGPLRHLYRSKRGHPEELFIELSRLAGALCTFGLEADPKLLPAYDHDNAGECFRVLEEHIRRHLEIILPTQAINIALRRTGAYFFEGEVIDQRCLDRARWIFGVRSSLGESDVIVKTPQLMKLCSSKFVPELVRRALPGLKLTHLSVPPAAIAAKVDYQYFAVNRAGPCWDHIVQTRQVGVYVPGDVPDAELELLVILEK